MSRHSLISVIAVILLFDACLVCAQWQPTRRYTVRDGLAQSQVGDITQDQHGYLWIATQGGLCRFDGAQFERYSVEQGLADSAVNAVLAVGDTIWIGTDRGGLARWEKGKITGDDSFPHSDDLIVAAIALLGDDSLVVATNNGLYSKGSSNWRKILEESVYDLFRLADGSVVVLAEDTFLLEPDRSIRVMEGITRDDDPYAVADGPEGIWMAGSGRSLIRISEQGVERFPIQVSGTIQTLEIAADGSGLWLGTTHGLWKRSPDGKVNQIALYQHDRQTEVAALLEDREGNLWVGTWGSGLVQIPPGPWTVFTTQTGLPTQNVWAFSRSPTDACLWMATNESGVVSWCGDRWGRSVSVNEGLPSATVYSLAHDQQGDLWIGTSAGLCRQRSAGALQCWSGEDGPGNSFIRALAPTNDGGMWVATDIGFSRWDGVRWQSWGLEQGLANDTIRTLVEDSTGRLWLAEDLVGLTMFDGAGFTTMGVEDGLPSDRIWSLRVSAADELLVGTENGLWIVPLGADELRKPTHVVDGLPSPTALFAIDDAEGRIWVGTTHGVALVGAQRRVERVFTAHDGLSDTESSEGSVWKDEDGALWFGMAYGITKVDTTKIHRNWIAPEVVLEKISLNDEPIAPFMPLSASSVLERTEIRIDPSVTHVRFDFTAPSFIAADMVQFRLALTCFGPLFGPPQTERFVTYHLLPPGRYQLGIIAQNNEGVTTPHPLWVNLDVRPPWYRTTAFQIVAFLFAALVGASVIFVRSVGQGRRQHWLEQEVANRTAQLDDANRQITRQVNQLRELSRTDPLTGLGNRRVLSDVLPVEIAVVQREVRRIGTTIDMARYLGSVAVMIDLDSFKDINDRWGHDRGDEVLRWCSEVLKSELREGDEAIRWGGEEFVVLLRGLDREGTIGAARRLLNRMAGHPITLPDGSSIGVQASIGFVQFPLGIRGFLSPDAWQRMIDLTDRLLYLAKKRGRGRACGIVWRSGGEARLDENNTLSAVASEPTKPPPHLNFVEIELDDRHPT